MEVSGQSPGLTVTQFSLGVRAHGLHGLCQRQPFAHLLGVAEPEERREEHGKVKAQRVWMVACDHAGWREGAAGSAFTQ